MGAADKKTEAKIRKLKERAFKLFADQKYEKAVDLYVDLHKLDPEDGEWPRRAADCHWHLKNSDQRLKYSLLAAETYAEARVMLKAIAMCKVVLSIDPTHKETQKRLAELNEVRPATAPRAQPAGVKKHGAVEALRAGRARIKARRPSLAPPATAEAREQKEEKTRVRQAAAAALRLARAQKRKQEAKERRATQAGRPKVRDPRVDEAPPSKTSDSSEKVIARVALKPVIRTAPEPARTPEGSPPSSAVPPRKEPEIPSLRLEPVPDSKPGPALDEMILSQRVPAKPMDSIPPAKGNVYSLTLGDIPDAELKAARVPNIEAPTNLPSLPPQVAVIDPDTQPPGTPTPVDSLLPGHVGLYDELEQDRSSLAQKNFGHIPLLSELDPEVLRQLITDVAMIELDANEVLFNEGDTADAMYVVVEGSVTAVTLPYGERPIELAHLGEGEFFGEIGLMSDQPRQATVSAHEPCRLLRFDREIVAVLVHQDPGFLATLLQFLKDRLVDQLMMSSPLFAPFNEEERYDLADQFEFLEIEPNSLLLETGQHPIGMYVLLTGEARLKGASEAGTVRKLGSGDIFGEQALLNSEVSTIEVKTTTKCFALCMPADAFPEVVMTHPTVLDYLTTLQENSKGELDVADDFLDHIKFF